MLFNSVQFAIFFPVVVILYFATPYRWRWVLLLAASYFFYMSWKVEYLILIIVSTLTDYYAAIQMGKRVTQTQRLPFLVFSLGINLGLLFAFKYLTFTIESFRVVLDKVSIFSHVPYLKILLPVGISFYTFQTLSYSIDVFRGKKKPEKHLGIFALYVSFFPQLVAGPIERSTHLLPQFHKRHKLEHDRVVDGLRLILWGVFKKVVIADRLAVYVDAIYNSPSGFHGLPVVIATYFFAFQIYCDFSGYSDIAIGVARIMGYDLKENFHSPYFSESIREFWSRWHISLSTWFRDYLYIPLGGNRVIRWRWLLNLFVVFVVSGLWHGANYTFLFWGALHGFYFVFSIVTSAVRRKTAETLRTNRFSHIPKYIALFATFHLVVFAWIFFRADSLNSALLIISNMSVFRNSFHTITGPMSWSGLTIRIILVLFLLGTELIQGHQEISRYIAGRPLWFRWAWYYALILFILLFGVFGDSPFIYFQF